MIEFLLVAQLTAGAFHGCPATGDATGPRTKALDALKNRAAAPPAVNPAITMEKLGTYFHDDRRRWSTDDAAEITGYVVKVTSGGSETVNCHRSDLRDIHIDLALTKRAPAHRSVIVELTPRWQEELGLTLADVRKLVGKKVTVTGWMLLDLFHIDAADNTHRGSGNWRLTAWELHPITRIVEAQ